MDSDEYKLLDINYSKEDKERIEEYNTNYLIKAQDLLKYNRDKLLKDKNYEKLSLEDRIKETQTHNDFKDFCRNYPIVSKYIIAFGLFSKKAFFKYLDWKAKVRPSDSLRSKLAGNQREQEKFKNKYIYAVYIKFLYQEKANHLNLEEINTFYKNTVNELNKDTDNFFDLYDKELAKQEKNDKISEDDKKKEIINQLKNKFNM